MLRCFSSRLRQGLGVLTNLLAVTALELRTTSAVSAQDDITPSSQRAESVLPVESSSRSAHSESVRSLARAKSAITDGLDCQQSGDFRVAATHFERALSIVEEVANKEDAIRVKVLLLLGTAYTRAGNDANGRSCLEEVVASIDKVPAQRQWLIVALGELSEIHLRNADYESAERCMRRASEEDKLRLGPMGLGSVRIGYLLGLSQLSLGKLDDGRSALRRASELHQTLRNQSPALAADILRALAASHQQLGESEKASALLRVAVKHSEAAFGHDGGETMAALCELGVACASDNEFDDAKRYLERSLTIARKLYGREAIETLQPLANLSALLINTGEFEKAQQNCELRLSIANRSLQDHPEIIAHAHFHLGSVLAYRADYPGARAQFGKAMTMLSPSAGEHLAIVRSVFIGLGALELSDGNYRNSVEQLEQAIKIAEESSDRPNAQMVLCLDLLARAHTMSAQYQNAEAALCRASEIMPSMGAGHDLARANLALTRGGLQTAQKDYKSAEVSLSHALGIYREELPSKHHTTSKALVALARVHLRTGEFTLAQRELQDAIEIRTLRFGVDHPDTAEALEVLGRVSIVTGDLNSAGEHLARALAIRSTTLGESHPSTALTRASMGELLVGRGDFEAARQHFEEALGIYAKRLGESHPDTVAIAKKLAELEATAGTKPIK